jgi:hypothetical protein
MKKQAEYKKRRLKKNIIDRKGCESFKWTQPSNHLKPQLLHLYPRLTR